MIVDSDQHLYETRSMWRDHIDPSARHEALGLEDDERGFTWLSWRGERLALADVHQPGDVDGCGRLRQVEAAGGPAPYRYDERLPDDYWDPSARLRWLDGVGLDQAVCFPNFGLLWERRLAGAPDAMLANMAAWNRRAADVAAAASGRLHPVAHLSLCDPGWCEAQLALLATSGITLAMIGPAPVHGRALSHPDHERLWAAFVDHGVTPVFHVADQPRVLDDAYYPADEESLAPVIESAFIWVPPAVALTDLIVHGVFDRHPALRIGIVELSSIWVPQYLLMLDGAVEFTTRMNGRPTAPLRRRPSEYVGDHVRVSSFSYEDPKRLTRHCGDLFMACSDYPHSEGTASPLADYARMGCAPSVDSGLFGDNAALLLH